MDAFPIFTEITILLLLAAFTGAIGVRLCQPLIVAFIAVGIITISVSTYLIIYSHSLYERLLSCLRVFGCRGLSVDCNPELVRNGDAEDSEFIASPPLIQAQRIVSTVRVAHINKSLIHTSSNLGYSGRIAVTAQTAVGRSGELRPGTGACLVLVIFTDAVSKAACRLLQQLIPEMPQ